MDCKSLCWPIVEKVREMLHAGEVIHADETRTQVLHEEDLLKELSAEERYEQRLAKVKPLLDEFFAWLESLQVSGKSSCRRRYDF